MIRILGDQPERLDKLLARRLPEHSRSRLAKLIASDSVTVDGVVARSSLKVEVGQVVELPEITETAAHDLTPADIELEVVFEDEWLLVVNKPRGLATHPAPSLKEPSLVNALLGRGQALSQGSEPWRPGIVHRLDKDTTGLMLVAKSDRAHGLLSAQMASRWAERRYLAIAMGEIERDRTRVEAPIGRDPRNRQRMAVVSGGKPAITHVEKLARVDAGTLVGCKLETGRTHQIRVHLQAIAHPVVGDRLYGPKGQEPSPLQLHAAMLAFKHPITEEQLELFAAPPSDFMAVFQDAERLAKVGKD